MEPFSLGDEFPSLGSLDTRRGKFPRFRVSGKPVYNSTRRSFYRSETIKQPNGCHYTSLTYQRFLKMLSVPWILLVFDAFPSLILMLRNLYFHILQLRAIYVKSLQKRIFPARNRVGHKFNSKVVHSNLQKYFFQIVPPIYVRCPIKTITHLGFKFASNEPWISQSQAFRLHKLRIKWY